MRVKRIVFINRAPFENNLDLNFSDKKVISLTGINGSGKTTILSYIVDAFYEMAKIAFPNEFSGEKTGKFYRVMSSIYNTFGMKCSLVYILFDYNGKDIYYIDLIGITSKETFNGLMFKVWGDLEENNWPIKYNDISFQLQNGRQNLKYIMIDENDSKNAFENNILTYFPSYRYEQPGYLNNVYQMKLKYKTTSDFSGYLPNPIEITSDLPEIANWIMDIAVDSLLNKNSKDNDLISILNLMVIYIFINKIKKQVNIGIGQRSNGGTRIQIVDAQTRNMIYPTIFNISAGEASLLCLFVELIKQADKIGKGIDIENIEGIVLIDEVDKHLHVEFQKEVLPKLITMFPKVQFILSTHSPFVNMGLTDELRSSCSIIDLDSGGRECNHSENEVFRQAYEVLTKENERYINFYNDLDKKVKDIIRPVVYLEGRTDEKYFKKAVEIFGYTGKNVDFQWIGHLNESGKEEFTGYDSLIKGMQFIKGRKPKVLHIFLFDCDTHEKEFDSENIVVMTMPFNDKHTIMNKGIENALELEELKLDDFYEERKIEKDYGNTYITKELDKMKLCDYICGLDIDLQKKILMNLKPVIEKIINRL